MATHRDGEMQEEDPMETIKRRLKEVGGMSHTTDPPRVVDNAVARLNTPLRRHVQRLTVVTPHTYRRQRQKERGLKSHAIQRFRYAATMVLILVRGCRKGRKYAQPENVFENLSSGSRTGSASLEETTGTHESELRHLNSGPSATRASIGWDLQMNLITQPQYRTPGHLKHILYMIRANKAFKMFPSDSELELARRISYERYDADRIIAHQGRPPDRFYYILSGKVNLQREYELQTGKVTKSLGYLKKGTFTDPEELEKQWNRQSSLICEGSVEVLLLNKEDFFHLHNSHAGPPIDFLRSQYLFMEFPCQLFVNHPEAIEYKFYEPERLVTKDTNNTRWMYVIKSGKCKCIRRQLVADIKGDTKFSEVKGIDKLGYVKQPSHADAMLGAGLKKLVKEGQRVLGHDNEMSQILEVEKANSVGNPYVGTLGISIRETPATPGLPSHMTSRLRLRSSIVSPPDSEFLDSLIGRTPGDEAFNSQDSLIVKDFGTKRRLSTNSLKSRHNAKPRLPPLSFMDQNEPNQPDGCFMKHRDGPSRRRLARHVEVDVGKPSAQRRAYIQLDGMTTGDIFGLNDVASTASSEPSGVSVVSEGAEIIKINKRFFRTHAGTVTTLKLDTLVREFMSEEDASENLERQETWLRYKTTLMDRIALKKYKGKKRWNRTLKPLSFSI
ncbi:uncharacterized protein LOC117293854 isoform X1 [Asterias rubens]|uniref:uncharacterized protein LOC117293854 isoform X1 n=2 Tax=Asterias rubens TaxID=7604 RepID=UPI00145534E3|nr:uncharacterized protein LOC117293854 isoform X1 [Asterias rubens]